MSSQAPKSCLKKTQLADNVPVQKQVRFANANYRPSSGRTGRSSWQGTYADRSGEGYENTSDPFKEEDCEFAEVDLTRPLTTAEMSAMTPQQLEARVEAEAQAAFDDEEDENKAYDVDSVAKEHRAQNGCKKDCKHCPIRPDAEDVEMADADDSDSDEMTPEESQAKIRQLEAQLALFKK